MAFVSIVNPYSEKENQLTNYLGLVLKYIYREDPELFQKTISALYSDSPLSNLDNMDELGFCPSFVQQQKKGDSIPDLTISQPSICINFEVKRTDWFYDSQITKHVNGMISEMNRKVDIKVLFLVTSVFENNIASRLESCIKYANDNNVYMSLLTFDDYIEIVSSIVKEELSKDSIVLDMLEDLDYHIKKEGYASSSWKTRLDVISSGNTRNEIENGFYSCPNNGGAHRHQRSKFFGAYWNKSVNYISEIIAVVTFSNDSSGKQKRTIEWNNTNMSEDAIFSMALERIKKAESWRKDSILSDGWLVFVLGDLRKVTYRKVSPHGMRNKRYFDTHSNTIEELVDELDGKTWE